MQQQSFGNRSITNNTLISDLAYGYAITIHRSQGSEYPFVIIPIQESQSAMLSRELLYTAITRASWVVILIGSRRAIAQAIKNPHNQRHTGLKRFPYFPCQTLYTQESCLNSARFLHHPFPAIKEFSCEYFCDQRQTGFRRAYQLYSHAKRRNTKCHTQIHLLIPTATFSSRGTPDRRTTA
jgi:superfamily I DNA and RNA helicase